MQRLLCDDLWQELKRRGKKAKRRMAAVAFFSNGDLIKFKRGDILIVDASDGRIKSGETSAKALRAAVQRGALVFSRPNLHAKVYVFDRTAVIGSANVSHSSSAVLVEAALLTDDTGTVSQVRALIETLMRTAEPVKNAFLKHISGIRVKVRRFRGSGRNRKNRIGILGDRTWIIGVSELSDDAFPDEQERAEAGDKIASKELSDPENDTSWLRWTGRDKVSRGMRKGDSVIEVWKSLDKKTVAVHPAAPVLWKQSEPTCVRFYIEEEPNRKKTLLGLRQFRQLAKSVGLGMRLGSGSRRCISEDKARLLSLMWADMAKQRRRRR